LAEWLGIGLQNQVRRFESATDLNKILLHKVKGDYYFKHVLKMFGNGLKIIIHRPEAGRILLKGPPKPDHSK
jgi:hypothetical protein